MRMSMKFSSSANNDFVLNIQKSFVASNEKVCTASDEVSPKQLLCTFESFPLRATFDGWKTANQKLYGHIKM